MTLLQLLAQIKDDDCVVLIDEPMTCRRHWGRYVHAARQVHVVERFPLSGMGLATEVGFSGGEWQKMLALIYMPGGQWESAARTAQMVAEIGGRSIIMACRCNWHQVPEGAQVMLCACRAIDVFGTVLLCRIPEPRYRSAFFSEPKPGTYT